MLKGTVINVVVTAACLCVLLHSLSKIINVPCISLTVEFLFYEFDKWNGDNEGDKLYATVGDVQLDLERFEHHDVVANPNNEQHGKYGDVSWSRFIMNEASGVVPGESIVQVHKVSIKVPPNQYIEGRLNFEFELVVKSNTNKVSCGIQEFRIVAHRLCKRDLENEKVEEKQLTVPQKCVGYKAAGKGGPHIMTFDGVKYDCQAAGEFVLMKATSGRESNFEIQGRFVKFGNDQQVTATTSVVIKSGSTAPVVQVNVPLGASNGVCKPFAFINKELQKGGLIGLSEDQPGFQSEMFVSDSEEGLLLFFFDAKIQVTLTARSNSENGCILSTSVCIGHDSPLLESDSFECLLGTPNGNKKDDWMTHDGLPVSLPTTTKEKLVDSYNYCVDNWW